MRKNLRFTILILLIFFTSCSNKEKELQEKVQAYLDNYNKQYQKLYYESSKAKWNLNTKIIEGDTTASKDAREASEKLAKFTGSKKNSEKAKKYLKSANILTELQVRQLRKILYNAAENPETAEEIVKEKIKVETEQTEKLFGFDFKIDGKSVTTNDIDEKLKKLTNTREMLKVWQASKEVGKGLKTGMAELKDLRNKLVQAL